MFPFAALLLAHWFKGGSGSDEVQDEFVGVPLHSGGDIAAHLGTTGNATVTSDCNLHKYYSS